MCVCVCARKRPKSRKGARKLGRHFGKPNEYLNFMLLIYYIGLERILAKDTLISKQKIPWNISSQTYQRKTIRKIIISLLDMIKKR